MKIRPRISAHVAVAVPFALWAACGGLSSGGGMPGTGGTSGQGNAGAGGAAGSQAGGAGSAGTAGIGGQSCGALIACCNSLADTRCVSSVQALEAQVAAGTLSEAALETTCQGNLQIIVSGHECAGTGGSGDGGALPNSDGGTDRGTSGKGGSAGTTGSAGAGGVGGAGGASPPAWTCEELAGTCTCYTEAIFSATSCSAGPFTCCYTLPPKQGISECTCSNVLTTAQCAMVSGGGMTVVSHCPP